MCFFFSSNTHLLSMQNGMELLWGNVCVLGLNGQLKDEQASWEPVNLNSLVSLDVRMDNCLHKQLLERSEHSQHEAQIELPNNSGKILYPTYL